jgi:hypothetical protein
MTAPTITPELEQPARIFLPCSVDSDWETPCPMTGTNSCPSDPAKQAKCPQC